MAPRLERTGNERERLGTLDRGAGTARLAPCADLHHHRRTTSPAYDVTGEFAGWVQVPHSEAWHGC